MLQRPLKRQQEGLSKLPYDRNGLWTTSLRPKMLLKSHAKGSAVWPGEEDVVDRGERRDRLEALARAGVSANKTIDVCRSTYRWLLDSQHSQPNKQLVRLYTCDRIKVPNTGNTGEPKKSSFVLPATIWYSTVVSRAKNWARKTSFLIWEVVQAAKNHFLNKFFFRHACFEKLNLGAKHSNSWRQTRLATIPSKTLFLFKAWKFVP